MAGCVELINTGRASGRDELRDLSDLQAMADRYAFAGYGGLPRTWPGRGSTGTGSTRSSPAARRGDEAGAIAQINALLSQTGASPQIVAHDGRGPHLHVSRPTSPLADRMAAHFGMGLAWLVVAGEARRVRSCESPDLPGRVRGPVEEPVTALL